MSPSLSFCYSVSFRRQSLWVNSSGNCCPLRLPQLHQTRGGFLRASKYQQEEQMKGGTAALDVAEAGSWGSARYFCYLWARRVSSGSPSRKVSGGTQREAKKLQPNTERSRSSLSKGYILYNFPQLCSGFPVPFWLCKWRSGSWPLEEPEHT